MLIKITNKLTLADVSPTLEADIKTRLTIENPVWIENARLGRWQGQTEKVLHFYTKASHDLLIPRGFCGQLIALMRNKGISYRIEDCRRALPDVDFAFSGTLKPFQASAVESMLTKDFGTLMMPTGSGKTVTALAIIAQRRQPTLIIVHSKELLLQWRDRINQFLNIPLSEIGMMGGGRKTIGKQITVGIVNSIYSIADQIKKHFGQIVVDECHRCPSRTFIEAVSSFDCKYMLGLSATPWRRDKLSKLIFWYLGDCRHTVDSHVLQDSGDILKAEIVTRETPFIPCADPTREYSKMLSELTENNSRNTLITKDIIREVSHGTCLILSDRKSHCENLRSILEKEGILSDVLTGDTSSAERRSIVERLNTGDIKVLIATGQLIGEGFDSKTLQTLFLATPVKFDGRLLQYLGRVLRPAPGKQTPKVFDYVDFKVGVLVNAARARQRVYANIAA